MVEAGEPDAAIVGLEELDVAEVGLADVVLVDAPDDDVVGVLLLPPPQAASNAATAGTDNPSTAARRMTWRRLIRPLKAS
jgi:hypothetical protein